MYGIIFKEVGELKRDEKRRKKKKRERKRVKIVFLNNNKKKIFIEVGEKRVSQYPSIFPTNIRVLDF